MQRYCRRYTEEGEAYARHPCPLSDYPRPELVRDSYFCLNGEWDFAVLRRGETPDYCTKIRVPYSPTSLLSGFLGEVLPKDRLFYRRRFARPDGFDNGRVLLHFGAAD